MSDTVLVTRVTGRVQGVAFRYWARTQAEHLGLRGWIRNEPDGAVVALIIGQEPTVQELVGSLRKGPPAAQVDRVETLQGADDGSVGFRITG